MQRLLKAVKMIFLDEKNDIFLMFALIVGEAILTSTTNICFRAKLRNSVHPSLTK